ncbi:MAG: hypothetical protein LUH07_02385 [Lachnospiraceae bacterium]|nr:hypothetical protein [Lachnospiraceae bacterium]
MLLPDNMQPELSIYYNGTLVLEELRRNNSRPVLELYTTLKTKTDMSFPVFMLSLDWLYLIDAACIDEKGVVKACLLKDLS